MEQSNWQWQEKGTAWYGTGIYHITLIVPSREPLLGKLIIPDNNPSFANVERTDLGNTLVEKLLSHPSYYPEIKILQFCLMPDHIHAILYVTRPMKTSIRSVVRSLWQGAKKLGRTYSLSLATESYSAFASTASLSSAPESYSGSVSKDDISAPFPIFTERPFIRPLTHRGQLQSMFNYIRMNPQRLATKRLMPGFFHVQQGIVINGRTYAGVGNIALLYANQYAPVHVRRKMIEEAEHGNNKTLRDYMNGCVAAARKGTVMVSPFISQQEKQVMAVLLKEGLPFIYLTDNGFHEYYKPQESLFDAVAAKRLLILSPWEHDPTKKHISRADCVALNNMAEEICTLSLVSESDSDTNNQDLQTQLNKEETNTKI